MTKIRLVVADDYPIVREGLRALLQTQHDMEVVGEASTSDEAIAATMQLQPDILLMDVNMPGCHWRQLIKQVKQRTNRVAVLVVTELKEEHYAMSSLRAGAGGFVNKRRSTYEIVEAVRQIAKTGIYISAELSQRLALNALGHTSSGVLHEQLSPREQEVFLKLAQGRSVGDIAVRLHLSPKTVSTHKTHIFKKLKLESIPALVRYAIEHELV